VSAPDPVRVVQDHLARAVAERTGLDPAQVPVDRPIAELGLGSRQLMELAAGLAELTGEAPDPSILFDHPTIAGLASALAEPKRAAATMPDGPRAPVVTDEIAIVSMAGRFPGAEDPEGLWRLLDAGRSAIGEVPPGRWNTAGLHDPDPDALGRAYSLRGGFLPGVDRFDAAFFGISPREAARMDPQQRLLLQTAWELVERAGIVPATLHGSATGVYIGLYDSGYLAGAGLDQLDGHAGTGAAASVASGRIAYTFGLHGPAVTVDTACSSSLVALHLAARALAAGECDLAMAGGATLMLSPRAHVEFSRLRGLSPSGVCRPFSADADGVVWSEGCGLVLLKRLPDARRDGDRVLAVLAGSAVNQDGRSQGLSAPNGLAQQRVVRAALAAAALSPDDIDYVEAHGTGTALGDPVEANALAAVFGPGRPAGRPLLVGSLKSNLGHLQAAAGIAGVVKTVLALRQGRLAASLHASRPTGHVRWDGSGLRLCDGPVPWLPGDRVRHAGVSAFGISGTNAHVILREAPPDPVPDPVDSTGGVLLALSARTPAALRGQAARLLAALEAEAPPELPAVAGALAHRRAHLEHRAVVADLDGLRALARDETGPAVVGPQRVRPPGRIAFVFPGQGAQWVGMGRDLLGTSPRFADELERCDAALRAHTGWSVVAVLRGDPGAPAPERVDVVQPALFAVMVALAAVWRAHGVRPAAVVGHSQGELAAACVAGALSLGDAAAVVALRSRALAGLGGGMAVIGLPADEVERHCERLGGIGVAAVNSGRSTVVAGEVAALEALLAELDARQVFARRLDVGYASHSPLVEPLRERLAAELDGVIASPAAVTWYSSVSAEPVAEELPAAYWYRNLREPVRFAATVERMIADGCTCFVELSPHPSLLTAIRTIAEDVTVVGSLRRGEDGLACLRRAAAELHVHGWPVDWRRLAPDRGPVELPTYAWDAQRHWIDPGPRTGGPWPFAPAQHPLLGVEVRSVDGTRWTFRAELSPGTASWLPHHRVFGRVVVSATTLAELCRAALAAARPQRPAYLSGLMLPVALILPDDGAVEVSVEVAAEPGAPPEITVHGRPRGADAWTLHACATAADASRLDGLPAAPPSWPEDADRDAQTYDRLAAAGLGYGPAFRGVESAVRTAGDEVLARLRLPEAVREDADSYPAHPALLDAALQAAALLPGDDRVMLPVAIGHYALAPGAGPSLTAAVRRTSHTAGEATLDVTLWDADGLPAGLLDRVRLRAADPAGHRAAAAARAARHLYEVAWTPVTPPPGAGIGETRVRCWPAVPADAGSARELAAAGLAELQQLVTDPPSRVVWVTRGAIATAAEDVPGLAQSVLWGLARTARAEHPDLALHLLDLDPAATDHAEAPPEVLRAVVASGEPELALRGGIVLAPRLVPARTGPNPPEIPTDGTVLVTGGLGAVGRQLARWLAHSGVPRLLLTSRRGPDDPRAAAARTELEALGAEVEIAACDAADARAVAALLTVPLRGVVHCAGVLADAALAEQSPERLAEVMRPKVDGALNLDRLTEGHPVTLFVLVSSAAAVAGSPGQANYAAANALLDQLAHRRRARGRPAVAIGFGAWSGGGLATGHADLAGMARRGYGVLTPEQGRELAALAVRRGPAHLLAWPLDLARLRESDRPPLWRALLPVRDTGRLAERLRRLPEPARRERILAIVREEAARVLGLPGAAGMKADEPLRDLGLDSLTAVDLRNRIAARIGRRLPATLLFDHPTPAGLAAHLAAGTRPVPDPQPQRADADEPIAVVGMACRLPGGVDSPDDLWDLLAAGRDAIGPFPADRWDVAALFDPDPDAAGKTYAREGGFLDAIDGFDAGFFGIAPREAAAMDPQQRLLLELAWEALERAGIVPDRLAGSDTGVYVGMFGSEYLSGSRLEQLDGYVGTGSALSVASGRLAYALRLHGPAVTVDTACSSSLVAVHLAAQALRGGECDLALAGGATLMVTPQTFVEFSRLRGLSPTGRCRSFAADADGAVWAEGGALVVLKRLADARRDGDEVLAVLAGSAVNQDGRSQGLAAPNGPAQERVVRRALRRSGLARPTSTTWRRTAPARPWATRSRPTPWPGCSARPGPRAGRCCSARSSRTSGTCRPRPASPASSRSSRRCGTARCPGPCTPSGPARTWTGPRPGCGCCTSPPTGPRPAASAGRA
jgi:acyl transferase domain-containing protein/acyl carrier protein